MNEEQANVSKSEIFFPKVQPRLGGSTSERNVYFMYVCLVNDVMPSTSASARRTEGSQVETTNDEAEPIQVERSRAVHELVQNIKKKRYTNTESCLPQDSDNSEVDDLTHFHDPKILQLTKMKWLSEDRDGTPDSSSPSISPARSTTSSNLSLESVDEAEEKNLGEKYLSTILRLDKEHNLFGLSNIAIVGSKQSRKIRKEEERPVFHQTAIVQVCCAKGCGASCGKLCCKHRTNTDLPSSLKCGTCSLCFQPSCVSCSISCKMPPTPCPPSLECPVQECTSCKSKCNCKISLFGCPKKCAQECYYGMTLKLNKKPKFEPPPVELTPRNSCILQLPYISRPCPHIPRCCPPSNCFPYLMPCFWPSRPSAPCHDPTKCFHNPPCMPPRRPRPCRGAREHCPKLHPCTHQKKGCTNSSCLGEVMVLPIEETCNIDTCHCSMSNHAPVECSTTSCIDDKKKNRKKNKSRCECSLPQCKSCFVMRPKVNKLLSEKANNTD